MVIQLGTFRSYEERLEEIQAQAVYWVAREQSGRMREAERIALREWLARSPAHELEYQLLDHVYASDELEAALALAPRHAPARLAPPNLAARLRPLFAGLGAVGRPAFAIAMALVLGLVALQQIAPDVLASLFPVPAGVRHDRLVTRAGERLVAHLPDGTKLYLDGDTELEVAFEARQRHVTLRRGNALLDVAHDAKRPFDVTAPRAAVRVLGTQFLISDRTSRTTVDVFRGTVEIDPSGIGDANAVRATRGSRVSVGSELVLEKLGARSAIDWSEGWIDEDALPLGELVAMIRERTGRHVTLDPRSAHLLVSGRFRISEPDAALKRLALVYPVCVHFEDDTIHIIVK